MTRIPLPLYLATVMAWVASSVLLPPWIGRSHNRDLDRPAAWHPDGA